MKSSLPNKFILQFLVIIMILSCLFVLSTGNTGCDLTKEQEEKLDYISTVVNRSNLTLGELNTKLDDLNSQNKKLWVLDIINSLFIAFISIMLGIYLKVKPTIKERKLMRFIIPLLVAGIAIILINVLVFIFP